MYPGSPGINMTSSTTGYRNTSEVFRFLSRPWLCFSMLFSFSPTYRWLYGAGRMTTSNYCFPFSRLITLGHDVFPTNLHLVNSMNYATCVSLGPCRYSPKDGILSYSRPGPCADLFTTSGGDIGNQKFECRGNIVKQQQKMLTISSF